MNEPAQTPPLAYLGECEHKIPGGCAACRPCSRCGCALHEHYIHAVRDQVVHTQEQGCTNCPDCSGYFDERGVD